MNIFLLICAAFAVRIAWAVEDETVVLQKGSGNVPQVADGLGPPEKVHRVNKPARGKGSGRKKRNTPDSISNSDLPKPVSYPNLTKEAENVIAAAKNGTITKSAALHQIGRMQGLVFAPRLFVYRHLNASGDTLLRHCENVGFLKQYEKDPFWKDEYIVDPTCFCYPPAGGYKIPMRDFKNKHYSDQQKCGCFNDHRIGGEFCNAAYDWFGHPWENETYCDRCGGKWICGPNNIGYPDEEAPGPTPPEQWLHHHWAPKKVFRKSLSCSRGPQAQVPEEWMESLEETFNDCCSTNDQHSYQNTGLFDFVKIKKKKEEIIAHDTKERI